MLIVEYTEKGTPVSDFNYKEWVKEVKGAYEQAPGDIVFKVSTEIAIQAIRVEIVQGNLSHKEVVFRYNNTDLGVTKAGKMNWPQGFCEALQDIYMELAGWGKQEKTQ